jgi:hypothetical protein
MISCSCKNIDSSNKEIEKLILNDTLKVNSKANSTSIIYLKNPETTDYFKYIFPIFTLLIGIAINRYLDYNNNKKKIKKSGKRWLAELITLEKPIESQIENIETFLVEHNKPNFTFPRPILVTSLDCEVFNTLDKSELIDYLQQFKKNAFEDAVNNSNKIIGFLTILKSHYENFKKHFEEYKINVSNYTTTVSRNLQGLQKEFVNYGILLEEELGHDPINDIRYKPIFDLFNLQIRPYMQNGNYDIYNLEANFLLPMISILSNLRLDPRTHGMKDFVQNMLTEIKGIRLEKTYISDNFETIKDWYIESKSELPSIIQSITINKVL